MHRHDGRDGLRLPGRQTQQERTGAAAQAPGRDLFRRADRGLAGPDAIAAGNAAVERGATWVDLNCGCPIHDVVKRGMGATLLQRPAHLGKLVAEMVKAIPVPVTVKIRLGWSEDEQNASEVAKVIEEPGPPR
jgi:hypothetical protein